MLILELFRFNYLFSLDAGLCVDIITSDLKVWCAVCQPLSTLAEYYAYYIVRVIVRT